MSHASSKYRLIFELGGRRSAGPLAAAAIPDLLDLASGEGLDRDLDAGVRVACRAEAILVPEVAE
jgi:hypothetical protein